MIVRVCFAEFLTGLVWRGKRASCGACVMCANVLPCSLVVTGKASASQDGLARTVIGATGIVLGLVQRHGPR
jgi:hypothetical protein